MKNYFGELSFEQQVNMEVGASEKLSDFAGTVVSFVGGMIEEKENGSYSLNLLTPDGVMIGTNSSTFTTSFKTIKELAENNGRAFNKVEVVAKKSNNGRTFFSAKYVG